MQGQFRSHFFLLAMHANVVHIFYSCCFIFMLKGGASVCSPDNGEVSTSSPTTASGSVSLASLPALVSALSIAYIGS